MKKMLRFLPAFGLGTVATIAGCSSPDVTEYVATGGTPAADNLGAGGTDNSSGGSATGGAMADPVAGVGGAAVSTGGAMGSGGSMVGGEDFDTRAHLLETAQGAPSEAAAAGVPSHWSWVAGATETRTNPPSSAYTHTNYWGALFRGPSNTTPGNAVVSIRNCSMWFLYQGDAAWTRADASKSLGGGTFSPTYSGGGPAPLVLDLFDDGADVVPAGGYIWHFWQENGYQPVTRPLAEIVTNCQAQLALRDESAADDRSTADFLLHMGADFRNPNDPSCANDSYICPSYGVSRFERVTIQWRNHTFHSLTEAELDAGTPLPPAEVFALPAL